MISDRELCEMAVKAMEYAYVPYSHYHVGAALLLSDGTVYTGCNIENASYTPTVCAERTAIFKAISEGRRDFVKIAVAGGKDNRVEGVFPPCGVCRQVMAEFCTENFEILCVKSASPLEYGVFKLPELLPEAFTPAYLSNQS